MALMRGLNRSVFLWVRVLCRLCGGNGIDVSLSWLYLQVWYLERSTICIVIRAIYSYFVTHEAFLFPSAICDHQRIWII